FQTPALARPVASRERTTRAPTWKWSPCGCGMPRIVTSPDSASGFDQSGRRASSCRMARVFNCRALSCRGLALGGTAGSWMTGSGHQGQATAEEVKHRLQRAGLARPPLALEQQVLVGTGADLLLGHHVG